MPSLYAADIDSIATPVNPETTTPKRTRKNAAKKTTTTNEVPPVPDVPEVPANTPVKKPLSEARKAALAKAQESRKRKREEREAEAAAILNEEQEKNAAEAAKKAARNEKRRVARIAKKQKTSEAGSVATESVPAESVPTTPKSVKGKGKAVVKTKETLSDSEPPSWFKHYVKGVKKEESKISHVKRPGKEINSEAEHHAQTQWKDGLVRDRLRNEVDSHMNKMYTMIFGNRRALH